MGIDFDRLFTSLEQSINQSYKPEIKKPVNSFYERDQCNSTTFDIGLGKRLGGMSKFILYKKFRTRLKFGT